ncbi:MAG TPA: hypothetical protein VGP89_18225 [Candidatus Angelobacter sp.]|nr:hypothetical protein [Candidatus Angelobacter sp.]
MKSVLPPDPAYAAREIVSTLPSGGRSGCHERRIAHVREGLIKFAAAYKDTHEALCTTMCFVTQKLEFAEKQRDAALKELEGLKKAAQAQEVTVA